MLGVFQSISIHAPRAGSDEFREFWINLWENFNPCSPCGERPQRVSTVGMASAFQSMLPVRGATPVCLIEYRSQIISIHAPRAGSDARFPSAWVPCWHFNPCSPCGERQEGMVIVREMLKFQSMLPVRGATEGGQVIWRSTTNFNPCSPCGERPMASNPLRQRIIFQSTLPVRGATASARHY